MKRPIRAIFAAGLLVAGSAVAFLTAGPAQADTQICEQFGNTTIQGRYVVMNNRWGTSAQQCINVTGTGFSIARQDGTAATNGAPVSYPAVYYGCHYTVCSPGTNLPIQVSQISSATSGISYSYTGGTYNASYDIWLDPTPRTNGVNAMEIMIWFNRQGPIQPIGSPVGEATVGGRSWQVWRGSNGMNNVISYVAPSAITSWNFSVLDFINDVRNRGAITNSWYLTSIQAGFEPWQGGVGLAVNSFSASVNGGGAPITPPTPVPPTTSPTPPPPGGGSGACQVAFKPNPWNTGFTAEVTVTNTGSAPINGWSLGFTLPAGQQITSTWNATFTGNSGAVTARSVGHNGNLAPGRSGAFGFQGTHGGTYAPPTAFTVNGATCSRG